MTPLSTTYTLDLAEPKRAEVVALTRWIARLRRRTRAVGRLAWTTLIVTPLGLPARRWLERELAARGMVVVARRSIPDWPRVATAVHVERASAGRVRRAALYEAAWRALFPGSGGEAWSIPARVHGRLAHAKASLRSVLQTGSVHFGPRGEPPAVLHAFHLADPGDAAVEARRLEAALALTAEPRRRSEPGHDPD